MPTKRCLICQKPKMIDEISLCCDVCEETELDLLMATYAYIHCLGNEYVPVRDLTQAIDPIQGVKVTNQIVRSWVNKHWLDENEVNSVRVPSTIREEMEESGFQVSSSLRQVLHDHKEGKPAVDPNLFKNPKQRESTRNKRQGMVYVERIKEGNNR